MLIENNYFNKLYSHIKNKCLLIYDIQNKNINSPFFGSFDYTYWRDKKTIFPDARFQEVLSTYAILDSIEPLEYKKDYFKLAQSSLLYLKRIQNNNGSFDEWYKGENGLAVSIFVGISLVHFKEYEKFNNSNINDTINYILKNIVRFVIDKNDLIKINHQAALIYLLIKIQKINFPFKIKNLEKIIKNKVSIFFEKQRNDGWFHEVAGKDIGYSFLILDYISMSYEQKPDLFDISRINRLYDNCAHFLEENLQHDKNLGFCFNGYFSAISTIILCDVNLNARKILSRILKINNLDKEIITDYLNDELRFIRWSSLPLIAYKKFILLDKKKLKLSEDNILKSDCIASDKSLNSILFGDFRLICSPFNGGYFKILSKENKELINLISLSTKNKYLISNGYKSRNVKIYKNGIKYEIFLSKVKFFSPSNVMMFLVSFLSNIYFVSKIIRIVADYFRKIIKTSLNQSDAPYIAFNGVKYISEMKLKIIKNSLYITFSFPKSLQGKVEIEISKEPEIKKTMVFTKKFIICSKYELL